jgi:DNA-binding NarL/FixJ family response regulator
MVLTPERVVVLCNEQMRALLAREDVEGMPLDEVCGPGAGRIVALLAETRSTGQTDLVTADGRKLALTLEVESAAGQLVLSARESCEHLSDPLMGWTEYEILPSSVEFGRLARLEAPGTIRRFWGADAPRCYVTLHARAVPCSDCPVLAGRAHWARARRGAAASAHELLTVDVSERRVRVSVREIARGELEAVRDARLDEVSAKVGLSELERSAIRALAGGATYEEAARALCCSVRTLKSVYAKLLARLGADVLAFLLV